MIYENKHYTSVVKVSAIPKTKKPKFTHSQFLQRKFEYQIQKEVEGEFSHLGVNPRTIEEVVQMQSLQLDIIEKKPFKASKRKRKFINEKRS